MCNSKYIDINDTPVKQIIVKEHKYSPPHPEYKYLQTKITYVCCLAAVASELQVKPQRFGITGKTTKIQNDG